MADAHAVRRAAVLVAPLVVALIGGQILSRVATGQSLPPSVVARGAIFGLANSLFVVALVLIYRAARIISFAHTALGLVAVMTYLLLRGAWGWSFYVVVPLVLVGAAAYAAALEVAVIRRFSGAPRLVLTVVTIALGQLLVGVAFILVELFGYSENNVPVLPPPELPLPNLLITWEPGMFGFSAFFAVGLTLILFGALAAFFRFSTTGIAIRGAAENRARAGLLGINVNLLSSLVWAVSGVLAAAGALSVAMLSQTTVTSAVASAGGAGFAGSVLLRALAAAIFARMERLPTAVAASLAIALIDQAVFWAFRQTVILDLLLFVGIVGVLLVQRKSLSRADAGISGTWEAAEELQAIPSVLAKLPAVRRTTRRFAFGLAGLVLLFPWVMSPSQTLVGSRFAIFGIVVVSLVVLTGWGGQISLGQFGFVAVGALVGGSLTAKVGVPFPVAVVAACVVGAVAAVLVGLPALRIQGLFLAVTSLGFAVVAQTILLSDRWFSSIIPRRVTRPSFLGLDMNTNERAFFYLCVVALAAAIAAATGLRRTRTGRVLIAMRDNERAAQSFGLSLVRTRLATFAIAGALGGLAGVLFANLQYGVTQAAFSPNQSIFVFLMAVMGGLGSVYGVLAGVLYFGVALILFSGTALQLLTSALGVLIVLIAFPGGLGGLVYRTRDAWLRRIALRYRVFVPSLFGVERRAAAEGSMVPIASRPNEDEMVPVTYTLPSLVATAGASQRAREPR